MGRKKIGFSEEQLEEIASMYRQDKSGLKIAEKFGVSYETVYRRLREMDVKIRPPAHLRDKFYFKRGDKPPQYVKRDIPDPWIDANAAYVFGVLIGDASIGFQSELGKRSHPKNIEFATPDREFVTTFSDAVESAFGIQAKTRPKKENQIVVRAHSVDLAGSYDRFKWRTETWRVPEEFFDAPEKVRIALCQEKLDSDGGVQGKSMVLGSIHRPGLEDMLKIVRSLGIEGKISDSEPRKGNRKNRHRLRIPRCPPNLVRLPRKRKALKKARK